jgi:molecular chaperone GrpE
MSKGKKKDKAQASLSGPVEPEETGAAAPEPATEVAEEAQTPEQQIETLRDENLRLMAELRNVRERAQREKQEALTYAEADFARELLVVVDDLERTQQAANSADNAQAVAEGVRIVYEHFLKVLRGRSIEPIEALHQPFDPDLHEALMQQPSAEHPAGTVIQELAHGYRMGARVIRPAKVVVSSGPPAAPEEKGERSADV